MPSPRSYRRWDGCRDRQEVKASVGCEWAGADQEEERRDLTTGSPGVEQRHPHLSPLLFIIYSAGARTRTRRRPLAGVLWGPTSGQGGPVQPWLLVTPVWAAEKTLHTNGWPRTSGNVQAPPASPNSLQGPFRRTGGPPQHRWGAETPWR
jgi:hypothetical protein